MKKALYSLALCALAITGCTSEEVVKEGPQSNAIKFTNVVNKDSRSLDANNFGLFYVYGYYTLGADLNKRFNIFTDTPVTKDEDGSWTSSINRYWIENAKYYFYAYSCENSHIDTKYGGPSVDQYNGTFRLNYTCHNVSGLSHDLIFASATEIVGKETGNQPVPFQFKHILSKVNLSFVSEFPEGYTMEISNVSISAFMNTGTFVANTTVAADGALGAWDTNRTSYDGTQTNTFNLSTVGSASTTLNGSPVQTSACYMIPHHYTTDNNPVKISFNIKVSNSSQTVLSNTLVGTWHPNWRMGTAYTYTVRISGGAAGMDAIKFAVGVNDWNEPADNNKPEEINLALDYQLQNSSENEPAGK